MADYISLSGTERQLTRGKVYYGGTRLRPRVNKITPVTTNNNDGLADCKRILIFNTKEVRVAEAWGLLETCLETSTFNSIKKIRRVTHDSNRPRLDVWVQREMCDLMLRRLRQSTRARTGKFTEWVVGPRDALGELVTHEARPPRYWEGDSARKSMKKLSSWRFAEWVPWMERKTRQTVKEPKGQWEAGTSVATVNINGFHRKKQQIDDFLRNEKVVACALQETLVKDKHYPIRIQGYTTYSIPAKDGFRGQALLIDEKLASYEVRHAEGDHLLHVKVSGIGLCQRPVHVIGVYMPSGGNYRLTRTKCIRSLARLVSGILEKEEGAPVMCLGDWNLEAEVLDKKLRVAKAALQRVQVRGSGLSRFPKKGASSGIDHIVCSSAGSEILRKPRVHRRYAVSDHRPVVASMRFGVIDTIPRPMTAWFDSKQIGQVGRKLVDDNRWTILRDMDEEAKEDVTTLAATFSQRFDEVARAHNVKCNAVGAKPKFPRNLKALLTRLEVGG